MKLQQTTLTEFSDKSDWQLIDVRSPGEYASGHIPTAINIPMDQLESRKGDLLLDKPILLICQSGKRAEISASYLMGDGFQLHILKGGMNNWEKAGQSMICNQRTRWSLERQVRLGAGLIVLTGLALSQIFDFKWIYLSLFAGAGLTFAGLTNFCPMAVILGKMPWNKCK